MLDSVLKLFGVKPPPILARHEGPTSGQPFAGKWYAGTGVLTALFESGGATEAREGQFDILGFDATGIGSVNDLRELYTFFHPRMRAIAPNARLLILANEPSAASDPKAAAVARGIEGFVRSLAREVGGRGATANLLYVAPGAKDRLAGPVGFFCGAASTYVSGQAARVDGRAQAPALNDMNGKVALVTGAARGIGAAIAARLAADGMVVHGVDVPAAAGDLERTCAAIGARAIALDLASEGADQALAAYFPDGIDVVVHNAGITRDRTLARMGGEEWDKVIAINVDAVMRANDALRFRDEARIVCLSSTSGIAGNFGQANYAASKAALIGYVAALAPELAGRGITINAVAPGFIETPMTARMPFLPREIGRRVNSLKQGGQPRDVAELVAFLCTPGAYGITGNTIRVCGQSVMGA